MSTTLIAGLLGSLITVTGAAWNEGKREGHPAQSIKNWLFGIGALGMLIYAILGYMEGGPEFYIFLEALIVAASTLTLLGVKDKISSPIILVLGAILVGWSFMLFEDRSTLLLIIGLIGISLGFAFKAFTIRRNLALTLGSILVAIYSYLQPDWIFFWLNIFFAVFSAYYLAKVWKAR